MLRSAKEIRGYVLEAEDGEVGRCKDFLFDERHWAIRYMVADTGKWLPGRKVLLSPIALGEPEWIGRRFPLRLTVSQVESAPSLDADAPVSRQHEIEHFKHYGWPVYWGGLGVWGGGAYPLALHYGKRTEAEDEGAASGDPCLHSIREVTGYPIKALDGEIGHVEDFIVHDASWTIRYLVVDTRNWLPGRKVLVAPSWIDSVDWEKRRVVVNLQKDQVRESPEYDPSRPVNREYEERLYDFYGRPHDWV